MKNETNKNPTGSSSDSITRLLLTCGIIAGPFYLAEGIFQMLIRPGFDPSRYDFSLMSDGEPGWIQIINFIVTGLLTIAATFGMWKVLHDSPDATWGPLLTGLHGWELIGASIFVADPVNSLPPGTSVETPVITLNGIMHFVTGGIGFLGFIAAYLVFARRFSLRKEKAWARFSRVTGSHSLQPLSGSQWSHNHVARSRLCHSRILGRSDCWMDLVFTAYNKF